jgi:hypothetical protein
LKFEAEEFCLFKKRVEGNSQYITILMSSGSGSLHKILILRCPDLVVGMT